LYELAADAALATLQPQQPPAQAPAAPPGQQMPQIGGEQFA